MSNVLHSILRVDELFLELCEVERVLGLLYNPTNHPQKVSILSRRSEYIKKPDLIQCQEGIHLLTFPFTIGTRPFTGVHHSDDLTANDEVLPHSMIHV